MPQGVYSGHQRYSLTFTTFQHRPLFDSGMLVEALLCQVVRATAKSRYEILAYCFMPDHLHLLVIGAEGCSSLPEFVKRAKQLTGYHGKKVAGCRIWPAGYYARTLRWIDDTQSVVDYILDNPVRAGLVLSREDYAFSGPHHPVPVP